MKKQYQKIIIMLLLSITGFTYAHATDVEQEGGWKSTLVETDVGTKNVIETPDELKQLYALSACLMDADTGRVLFEKSGFKKLPMASTTKIMTCIVTLENSDLNDVVTISKNSAKQPDVQLKVREGEQYKLKDLLYSLMLESHNDVAVAIAEHVGGSVAGFAKLMNKKAKKIGCRNTNFVTPNGLDAEGHYTTAVELGKIASYCIKNDEFIKITNTPSYSFSAINRKRNFTVNNKDSFLNQMTGAVGVKTGFTGSAGYCFVGALKRDNKTFVSVVLGSGWPPNKSYKWKDTRKLMNYGLNCYNYETIFKGNKKFREIAVENGIKSKTETYTEGDLCLLLNKKEEVTYNCKMPSSIKAPIYEGSTIGYVNVLINNNVYAKYPIKVSQTIPEIDFHYCFNKILNLYLLGY